MLIGIIIIIVIIVIVTIVIVVIVGIIIKVFVDCSSLLLPCTALQ